MDNVQQQSVICLTVKRTGVLPVISTEVEISDYNQIVPQTDFLKGSLQIFEGFAFTVGRLVKDTKSNFTREDFAIEDRVVQMCLS